ncbi:MAG: cysteine desulfurase [Planctomycetes bacterium]|nr:cysteine desulfurase [Planctomycetota bacterium]
MDLIYLDHGATTLLLPEVWEAMRPFHFQRSGNPASSHHAGRSARRALEDARERIAQRLDAQPDEVLFTSGATEANNLAIFGLAGQPPNRIVASSIEHPCVSEPVRQCAAAGFEVQWLPVTADGLVPADALRNVACGLACVMLANHETGAVQPVTELAASVAGRAAFHCDAAAAVGKLPVSFRRLGVTALTLSAHKFHGPKGIGALVLRRGVRLQPRLFGGHQQYGLRPGTEPVPLAVGMATALELACAQLAERHEKVVSLRNHFLEIVRRAAPIVVNGPEDGGVPHTLNVSFPGCRADMLLMTLDLAGVACATGSACSSGSLLPSPVLKAMGVADDALRSALRFTFSFVLTQAEVAEAARRVVDVVTKLRR